MEICYVIFLLIGFQGKLILLNIIKDEDIFNSKLLQLYNLIKNDIRIDVNDENGQTGKLQVTTESPFVLYQVVEENHVVENNKENENKETKNIYTNNINDYNILDNILKKLHKLIQKKKFNKLEKRGRLRCLKARKGKCIRYCIRGLWCS